MHAPASCASPCHSTEVPLTEVHRSLLPIVSGDIVRRRARGRFATRARPVGGVRAPASTAALSAAPLPAGPGRERGRRRGRRCAPLGVGAPRPVPRHGRAVPILDLHDRPQQGRRRAPTPPRRTVARRGGGPPRRRRHRGRGALTRFRRRAAPRARPARPRPTAGAPAPAGRRPQHRADRGGARAQHRCGQGAPAPGHRGRPKAATAPRDRCRRASSLRPRRGDRWRSGAGGPRPRR